MIDADTYTCFTVGGKEVLTKQKQIMFELRNLWNILIYQLQNWEVRTDFFRMPRPLRPGGTWVKEIEVNIWERKNCRDVCNLQPMYSHGCQRSSSITNNTHPGQRHQSISIVVIVAKAWHTPQILSHNFEMFLSNNFVLYFQLKIL